MAVTSQNPVITYTASGSATVFPYPYLILVSSDVSVYVNGVHTVVGYTVDGVGNIGGGNVTFTVPPAAGSQVKLLRSIPRTRTTDYTEGGALRADTLNDDIDRVVLMMQDVRADSPSLVEFEVLINENLASTAAAAAAAAASELAAIASAAGASVSASSSAANAAIAAAAAGALTTVTSIRLLGRTSPGTGSVEQISVGAGLTLASGVLSAEPGVPVGAIFPFPATAAPTGYLKLNGALLSRTTYAALWAYAHASGNLAASDGAWQAGMFSPGDGSTTFRIPDGRGEFIRGWDNSRGVDSGRAIGTTQGSDNLSHNHTLSDPTHAHGYAGTMLLYGATPNVSGVLVQSGSSVTAPASTGISIQSSGGAEARPRNIALLMCIKY